MNKYEILEAVKAKRIDIAAAKKLLQQLRQEKDAAQSSAELQCYTTSLQAAPELTTHSFDDLLLITDRDIFVQETREIITQPVLASTVNSHWDMPDTHHVRIDGSQVADWEKLFGLFDKQEFSYQTVLFIMEADDISSVERIIEIILQLLKQCYSLIKVNVLAGFYGDYHLLAEEAVAGFLNVVKIEKPEIHPRVLFMADNNRKLLLRTALAELSRISDSHLETYFINNSRWLKKPQNLNRITSNSGPSLRHQSLRQEGNYFITGGAGGIGMELAEYLITRYQANIILCGRSEPDHQLEKKIDRLGKNISYIQVDITSESELDRAIKQIEQQTDTLHGVFHLAAVLDDSYVMKMDVNSLHRVLAPKLQGTYLLDKATRHFQLDFFALFSSISSLFPGIGQAAYSCANRAMTALGKIRNRKLENGSRSGRTFIFHWPLWARGGMTISAQDKAIYQDMFGMQEMPSAVAFEIMETVMASTVDELWMTYGQADKMEVQPQIRQVTALSVGEKPVEEKTVEPADTKEIENFLTDCIFTVTQIQKEKIYPDRPFENFGLDSIYINQLNRMLASRFSNFSKTAFFEYKTIRSLAGYLSTKPQVQEGMEVKQTVSKPIENTITNQLVHDARSNSANEEERKGVAIIGLAGRFPAAACLDELLVQLREGRDCITEIPESRWPFVDFYPSGSGDNSHSATSGGYIDDVELFDPFFFGISPREAEVIDPQERLFLQTAWHAMEQGGYSIEKLHHCSAVTDSTANTRHNVGVYVGIAAGQYANIINKHSQSEYSAQPTSWSVANRVSYFLDLHGPSIALDTACSSSLTALHYAVEALQQQQISMAIVGGVNLNLDPKRNDALDHAHMLSKDRRCHSFGSGGDGFVPGEGVIAVLLKPLKHAVADGDYIQGVIRGSSLNHGGRTNGYTVPSPAAHASLIVEALQKESINPASITYLEAHGTGTELGDPIEIEGLRKAFTSMAEVSQGSCAIGSIKTNIGHLEAAAAIAGLCKVVLQFRTAELFPSLHGEQENPNIDFASTPFYLQNKLAPWQAKQSYPRRAALSSFGLGGSNGHIIIEEYIGSQQTTTVNLPQPTCRNSTQLLLFSATSGHQLQQLVSLYIGYLANVTDKAIDNALPEFSNFAFMLQTAREHLDYRLAFIAEDYPRALEKLKSYLDGENPNDLYTGHITDSEIHTRKICKKTEMEDILNKSGWQGIIEQWMLNVVFPWHEINSGTIAGIHHLPLYPFDRKTIWFRDVEPQKHNSQYPYKIETDATGEPGWFTVTLSTDTPMVADHRIKEQFILAGTAQLELVRKCAVEFGYIHEHSQFAFRNIVLGKAVSIQNGQIQLNIQLISYRDDVKFIIQSNALHSRGEIVSGIDATTKKADWPSNPQETVAGSKIYDMFDTIGYEYGKDYRRLSVIELNEGMVCSQISSRDISGRDSEQLLFHPGIVDSCLQSIAVLDVEKNDNNYLPFSIGEIKVYKPAANITRAIAEKGNTVRDGEQAYHIEMFDAENNICIEYNDFVCRAVKKSETADNIKADNTKADNIKAVDEIYLPQWEEIAANVTGSDYDCDIHIIFSPENDFGFARALEQFHLPAPVKILRLNETLSVDDYFNIMEPYQHKRIYCYFLAGLSTTAYNIPDSDCCREKLTLTVHGLFRLSQAIFRLSKRAIKLDIIANDMVKINQGDNGFNVFANGIVGMSKVLSRELPAAGIRLIDLSHKDIERAALTKDWNQLINNIHRVPTSMPDSMIALRQQRMYREVFTPGRINVVDSNDRLRHRGVYLILGGAGGLGKVTAQYLSENYQATVILTGRKNQATIDLSDFTGNCSYIQADINDSDQMHGLVQQIIEQYGALHGVFHSAFVLEDRTIVRMSEELLTAVLAPKTIGTVNVLRALENIDLDFLVFYSSGISQTCGAGQANYAAASTLSDAIAGYAKSCIAKVLVINWGVWSEVGSVAHGKYRQAFAARGVEGIKVADGLRIMHNALNSEHFQIIAGSAEGQDSKQVSSAESDLIRAVLPSYKQTMESIAQSFDQQYGQEDLSADFETGLSGIINDLLLVCFQKHGLLCRAGEKWSIDKLAEKTNVDESYKALFRASLTILQKFNSVQVLNGAVQTSENIKLINVETLKQEINQLVAQYPDIQALINLLQRCTENLFAVMSRQHNYTQVMFPKGSDKLVAPLYSENPAADALNQCVAEGLQNYLDIVGPVKKKTPIKILEVGAGTGGTTKSLLPVLAKSQYDVSYDYTDISSHFVNRGQDEFADQNAFMNFFKLDIEDTSDLLETQASYDIVIATNVLHATKNILSVLQNIQRLLTDSGLLVINESTDRKDIITLTFGLSTGWWLFNDAHRRIPDSPLLSAGHWAQVLTECGYHDVQFIGDKPQKNHIGHSVIFSWAGQVKTAGNPMATSVNTTKSSADQDVKVVEASNAVPYQKVTVNQTQNVSEVTLGFIRKTLSDLQKIPLEDIDDETSFERYGVDSIVALEFLDIIEKQYDKQSSDLLFNENTVLKLARFLDNNSNNDENISDQDNNPEKNMNKDEVSTVTKPVSEASATATVETNGPVNVNSMIPLTQKSAQKSDNPMTKTNNLIAIVGLSGRYPDAKNIDEFWHNLVNGKASISKTPKERMAEWNDIIGASSQWGAYIDNIDCFDSLLFSLSPRDAERMDPQERLLLEVIWETLEDGGYTAARLNRYAHSSDDGNSDYGNGVGVFAGTMYGHYELLAAAQWSQGKAVSASSAFYSLANNISRTMDFRGPSLTLDSACSSSLSCLHVAIQNILSGDCKAAIAGGVNLVLHPVHYAGLDAMKMISQDGLCRIFSAQANGFVVGEGVGAVLLKPLVDAERDNDQIYAVVRATTLNSNGATASAVPSKQAQSDVIYQCYHKASLQPDCVQYIETQSMGSLLGDKTEIEALDHAFGRFDRQAGSTLLGSVKPNIGHLEAAAGMAQLSKVLLQMKNRTLVKTLCNDSLRTDIPLSEDGLTVVMENTPWLPGSDGIRRAGISSFGAGGSNVHVLLEEYQKQDTAITGIETYLLPISARKPEILRNYVERLIHWLKNNRQCREADLAYTFQLGRLPLRFKLCIVFNRIDDLLYSLQDYLDDIPLLDGFIGEAVTKKEQSNQQFMFSDINKDQCLSLSESWVSGSHIDWEAMYETPRPNIISLPTYPFEPVRHWFDVTSAPVMTEQNIRQSMEQENLRQATNQAQLDKSAYVHKESFVKEKSSPTESPITGEKTMTGNKDTTSEFLYSQADIDSLVISNVGKILNIPVTEIRLEDAISEYGFDSITLTEMLKLYTDYYPIDIDVTIFFEHQTLKSFSCYLFEHHREKFSQPFITTNSEPQAAIGNDIMSQSGSGSGHHAQYGGNESSLPLDSGTAVPQEIQTEIERQVPIKEPFTQADIDLLVISNVGKILNIPVTEIRLEDAISEYGFDSITLTEMLKLYTDYYPIDIDVTIFFEHQTLKSFSCYLFEHHREKFSQPFITTDSESQAAIGNGITSPSGSGSGHHAQYGGNESSLPLNSGTAVPQEIRTEIGQQVPIKKPFTQADIDLLVISNVGKILNIPVTEIRLEDAISEYGFDSITLTEMLKLYTDYYPIDIDVTIFFEHQTLKSFSCYLFEHHREKFSQPLLKPEPEVRSGISSESTSNRDLQNHNYSSLADEEVNKTESLPPAPSGNITAVSGNYENNAGINSNNRAGSHNQSSDSNQSAQISQLDIDLLVKSNVARILNISITEITLSDSISEYSFDSITLMELVKLFTDAYAINIDVTIFFEHQTLESFSRFLFEHHWDSIATHSRQGNIVRQQNSPDLHNMNQPVAAESTVAKSIVTEGIVAENTVDRTEERTRIEEGNSNRTAVPLYAKDNHKDIAIIGMSGRFPGSKNLDEYWKNLCEGKSLFQPLPERRKKKLNLYRYADEVPEYDKYFRAAFIDDIDLFDPLFFKIAPVAAKTIDPQQRLMLERAWLTIEHAGYNPRSLAGTLTGVFIGVSLSPYANFLRYCQVEDGVGDITSALYAAYANRISFVLDLQGPSEAIDTACSSSLLAVHRAMQSIRSGESEMAIAGGINLLLDSSEFIVLGGSGMLAEDGVCKSFDDRADGYVRGEGVGAIFLKPLQNAEADGDYIHAVLRGSAVRHGGHSTSMSAPNVLAQERLINQALKDADVAAEQITYIETHGTGTKIGDPIEINALKRVFAEPQRTSVSEKSIALGTVKSNIGHLETAAGIAGLIKTILCMKHKKLPPLATLKKTNQMIHLEKTPLYLLDKLKPWDVNTDENGNKKTRYAGVSSFGVGGVIVHLVLQEAVEKQRHRLHAQEQPYIIVLSAKSKDQLLETGNSLLNALSGAALPALHDLALTLLYGREAYEHRLAIVASSMEEFLNALTSFCSGNHTDHQIFYQNTEENKSTLELLDSDSDLLVIRNFIQQRNISKIASMWSKGFSVPWEELFDKSTYQKVPLPGYHFAREYHWPILKDVIHEVAGDESSGSTEVKKASEQKNRQKTPEAGDMIDAGNGNNDSTRTDDSQQLLKENHDNYEAVEQSVDSRNITMVQEHLMKVFAEILYIPLSKVNPDSPFADYGVDSLSGLRIMQRLQQEYGEQLPVAAVLDNDTIRKLAVFIVEETSFLNPDITEKPEINDTVSTESAAPLKKPGGNEQTENTLVEKVQLMQGNTHAPLIVFCGTSGELSWIMHWLPVFAEDQLVLGLEANRSCSSSPSFTLDDFVTACVNALADFPKSSTLRLAGFGLNAVIVNKVAKELIQDNYIIEKIYLFNPNVEKPRQQTSAIAQLATLYNALWTDQEQRKQAMNSLVDGDSKEQLPVLNNWLVTHSQVPMPADKLSEWLADSLKYIKHFHSIINPEEIFFLDSMSYDIFSSNRQTLLDHYFSYGNVNRYYIHAEQYEDEIISREAPYANRESVQYDDEIRIPSRQETDQQQINFVTLNTRGHFPRLYCFPTLYGDVGYAATLSLHLGSEVPLYAFEQWEDLNAYLFSDLKVLAHTCVQRLLQHQPEGPYSLMGLSFGGIVAYEACYQLQSMGKEVNELILLDPYMPNSAAVDVFNDIAVEVDGKDVNQLGLVSVIYTRWHVRKAFDYDLLVGQTSAKQLEMLADHLSKESPRELSYQQAHKIIETYFKLDSANRAACKEYMPAKLSKPVNTLMVSTSQGFFNPANHVANQNPHHDYNTDDEALNTIIAPTTDISKGFRSFINGNFKIVELDTDHMSMPGQLPVCAHHVMEFLLQCQNPDNLQVEGIAKQNRRIIYEI